MPSGYATTSTIVDLISDWPVAEPTPEPTFNLTALAERILLEKRHRPLAGKIQRASDFHSLSTDLAMALEALDAFDRILAKDIEDFDTDALKSALLNNALILYARATKSQSNVRKTFDLRSKLTDAQKAIHRELIELRDDAVAHFGSGGSYRGEWQATLVVLQIKDGVAKPGVATKRQVFDEGLARRLRQQLEVAHAILRERSLAALDEVSEALNQAMTIDEQLIVLTRQHPLNLDLFMGSAEAAEMSRSSIELGYWKGSIRHRKDVAID